MKSYLKFSFFLAIIFIASCKKEDENITPQQKQEFAMATSQADAEAELVFDDLFDNTLGVSDEVGIGGTGVFGTLKPTSNNGTEAISQVNRVDSNACFIVTTTQIGGTRFPLQVTLDFGAGCLGRDGRTRKGKIIINYTGRLLVPGNSASVSFDGYSVNDIQVSGSYKITNTGTTSARSFTIEVSKAKLTKPNGNYTEWNSTRTITQVAGELTPVIVIDDVFSVSGEANGTVKRGDKLYQWSTRITESLVKRFNCPRIVRGTIELRKGNTTIVVLDYGSGVCDDKATYTVDGTVYEITLH
jgi:hypothetical protein